MLFIGSAVEAVLDFKIGTWKGCGSYPACNCVGESGEEKEEGTWMNGCIGRKRKGGKWTAELTGIFLGELIASSISPTVRLAGYCSREMIPMVNIK